MTNLQTTLANAGFSADLFESSSLPTNISQYKIIWRIDLTAIPAVDETTLEQFVQAGGSLYLTGERLCCEAQNQTDQTVINNLVLGAGVTVGGFGDANNPTSPEPVNPAVIGGLATTPNTLTTWLPDAAGGMSGIASSSIFTSTAFSAGTLATGAAWAQSQLAGGSGRLAILMDINWLEWPTFGDQATGSQVAVNLENFLTSGTGPFYAQGAAVSSTEEAGGNDPSEGANCGCSQPQPPAGEPVNTATGDYYSTNSDLAVPGGGLPLSLTTSYDAVSAQTEIANGTSAGPLGFGWSDSLGMTVSVNSTTGIVTVTQENGSQITFDPLTVGEAIPANLQNAQGVTWCPSDATQAVYCPAAPRFIGTLNRNVDPHGVVTWAFARTLSSTTTFAFNSAGALTGVTDAGSDAITETSGTPGSGQCPTTAAVCQIWSSSVSGRSVTLAIDSSGNLSSAADQAGNTTAYCHFGQTCAPGSGGQAGDLASKTLFSGTTSAQTTAYTYDTANANVDLRHDVLVVNPPGNQAINETQNTYDASGRITNQTDPGGAVFTFAYSGSSYAADNGSSAGGATTVTSYPNGTGSGKPSTVDVYSYIDGVQQSEVVDTAGVDKTKTFGRDTASLIPTQSTDLNGHTVIATVASAAGGSANPMANVLTSTDAVGNKTQYAYTALNLPWCTVSPAETANGVVCPATQPSGPPAPGASNPNPGVALAFYDTSGRVTAKTDALGNTTKNSLTSGVSGIPNGLTYCSVDPVDYQKSVVCPAYGATHVPGTATQTFDAAGDVLTSSDGLGNVTTNTYDTSGRLHSTQDPDGTTTTDTYNAANQIIQQTQTFGATTSTTLNAYDALGRKYCTVAASQVARGVTCPATEPTTPPTPANPATLTSDPYLGATIDTFDAVGRVIQETSPTGGVTYSAYDDAGNKFCTVGPLAAISSIRCPSAPPATPPTPSSDPYLGATIDTFNALGQLVQETNSLGGITTHAYDPNGNDLTQVVSSSDATNDPPVTTTNNYDADNRVIGTTVAPSTTVASTNLSFFDPNGNVFCTVSRKAYAAGSSTYQCPTWQSAWIAAPPAPGVLYSTTPSAGQANNTATTFYNPIGNVDQTTTATGGTTVTGFDADSRTVCSISATDFTTWIAANPSGTYPYACPNPPLATPPTGATAFTTTIVDADGHATSVTDPVGNTTTNTFGPDGETLVTTAPGNQVTTNCSYRQTTTCASGAPSGGGVANALYSTTQPGTTPGSAGALTTYSYYPGGAAHVTTTVTGTTTDAYDQGSGLLTETNVPTAGYAHTPNVTYTDWPDGSRESMIDGNGSTSYAYDAMANLTQQQFTPNGTSPIVASTVSDTYFDTGAKKSIGYPTPSSNVTHTYDAAGNLATVTDWLGKTTTVADVPSATTTTYPNATQVVSTPDLSGGTTSVVAAPTANPNSPLVSATYQRNSADQVTSETDTGAIAASTAYTYDPNQRLGSVNTTSTSYDPASDPTALGNGTTQTFNGAGQVTSSVSSGTTTTLSYNSAGDRTGVQPSNAPSTQYAYDQNNQLTSVSTTPPIGTSQVSAGYDQTLALRADGTVWAWGNNGSGQLGNGTTTSSSVPVQVRNLTNVVAVSAGYEYSSALKADGTVWTWGSNAYDTLGDGNNGTTQPTSTVPVQVTGLTGVTQISAGGFTMEALISTGVVWDWGDNIYGTLGNGNYTTSASPVRTTSFAHPVTSISAGFWFFESAVDSTGALWVWGDNTYHQLSNGSSAANADVPKNVTTLPTMKSVSAGGLNMLALSTTGNIYAWGDNSKGQLALPTTTAYSIAPSQVTGVANASAISAGTYSDYALSSTGTTQAWGTNANGELDNGNTTQQNSPITMTGVTNATQISGGAIHVAILTTLGTIEAVGGNGSGQLGYGGTTDSHVLGTVSGWSTTNQGTLATTSYSYDGDGVRVGATTSTSTKTSVWDTMTPNPEILTDGINSFIYGASGQAIEQISANGTPSYFIQDQLGSTRALTNSSGQVVATYSYNANGVVASHTGTITTPIGYAGGYTDPSGLLYLVHRYYDPATGQFLSVDPLVAQTGQPYQYAGNNPVNGSDPNGQCTEFNISCTISNEIWYVKAVSSGANGHALSNKEAVDFLIDNNFKKSDAANYVAAFVGQIYINVTSNLPLPIFRYYSGPEPQGYFFADTYYSCANDARAAYDLYRPKTKNVARFVAQVSPNANFPQSPLVLEGHVADGGPNVLQFMAFDPNEFVYGRGVHTNSGSYPPPPPVSFPFLLDID